MDTHSEVGYLHQHYSGLSTVAGAVASKYLGYQWKAGGISAQFTSVQQQDERTPMTGTRRR